MKLPNTAHTSRPWRIRELIPDFRLEDVWALPTPGGPDDFPRLVQEMTGDPAESSSRVARTLWAIRWKVGAMLGWDRPDSGHGSERSTLRDRLPADLREGPSGPDFERASPFTSLYLLDDEWAAEIVNRTVHGVMHIGWVPGESGGYRGEMAVYVKPNGLLGAAYMAAIRPFRHLIVYPPLMRQIERDWRASGGDTRTPRSTATSPRTSGRPPRSASADDRRATRVISWGGEAVGTWPRRPTPCSAGVCRVRPCSTSPVARRSTSSSSAGHAA